MKTQLLEDIGENATLPPTPPRQAGQPTTDKIAPVLPPAPAAAEPDLDSVFEEIAALEAQYQPPAQQQQQEPPQPPQPALEPTMPRAAPVSTPAEPSLAPHPAQDSPAPPAATLRQDPLFDFTLPLPEQAASDPFTPPPFARARPKRRYLLWAACALGGALLVQGGWWLYQERKDEGSLAFVATQANGAPQADRARPEQVPAPATPATPAPPPLVMLEPDPPAPVAREPQKQEPAPEAAEPDTVAETAAPAAPPKPAGRVTRRQSDAAKAPAPVRAKREPARQIARAPVMQAEAPEAEEGPMTALLRACRAHGYHATQCIKQGCSVTRYGFACRGR